MAKKAQYNVAVVGAMGMVGGEMIRTLERRNFPVAELRPLDIAANAGKEVSFRGKNWKVQEAKGENFEGIDIAIFSAGGDASLELAPKAAERGAVVVDNSSAWRMDPKCPLVVPEVNPADLKWHNGIIANPNCSTIQMVVALKPLHDYAKIKRVVVSTYQAVSGAGKAGTDSLTNEAKSYLETGKVQTTGKFQYQIAFNCIPHIDVFQEGGNTKEENKMIFETCKIMGDDSIKVSATCVRVPVWYGHSESVNIETERPLSPEKARGLLATAPGIKVVDEPAKNGYPMPLFSNDEDLTMVGRIRKDESIANGLNMWVVSNNVRKGAALNAVQVAESLLEQNIL
ncbi:aspartate-semialdehyde dehydrogenase [Sediminispirochaeta smaragdinae]|uniref:Aspartate-semialdehyde dehydrogenase n=1 Tax=Sediminispirochaeta smaragdinae (strain DSM 11293 / JCM 15392 / SEBR 4228) TaxID=573413 RepID=E1RBH9_SEDSS|nr:aspartate-semialdehyde dehydrogenase [Sediminispirochaeta smaragdinae]ADK79709.1 aspartate-semialdehyde dehydrogenase [Sediminispirochaeta smaragdinae DSM 11293]